MVRSAKRLGLVVAILMAGAGAASAHTGAGEVSGLVHGFLHPLGGLDHILAMVAVGLFAAQRGGRALWLIPASFVVMMAVGGMLGVAGAAVPMVELGIAASVIVIGLAVALRANLPVVAAMALAGFFAIFHGFAHGTEMHADTSGLAYGAGFLLATGLLHAVGLASGLGLGRLVAARTERVSQMAGGAMALAGAGILTGLL